MQRKSAQKNIEIFQRFCVEEVCNEKIRAEKYRKTKKSAQENIEIFQRFWAKEVPGMQRKNPRRKISKYSNDFGLRRYATKKSVQKNIEIFRRFWVKESRHSETAICQKAVYLNDTVIPQS